MYAAFVETTHEGKVANRKTFYHEGKIESIDGDSVKVVFHDGQEEIYTGKLIIITS